MDDKNNSISWYFVMILISLVFLSSKNRLSVAVDTLSVGESLIGNKTLTSKGGDFELGFFRPGKSLNWYIGIWYRKVPFQYLTVVWVANRDTPLTDASTSELKLLGNGTLVLYDASQVPIWSTSSSSSTKLRSSQALLGDEGNLVVRDVSNASSEIWQSFDEPTNTWLPGGKFGFDRRTNKSRRLISWRNEEDPAPGIFSLQLDIKENIQLIMKWNMFNMYWASGEWNRQRKAFRLVPEMRSNHIYKFSHETNDEETYFTYALYDTSVYTRFVVDLSGQMKLLTWSGQTAEWKSIWLGPNNTCDVYGVCGAFGVCDQVTMTCSCLQGFREDSSKDWSLGGSTGRCVRKAPLQCGSNVGFSRIENMSLPPQSNISGVNSLGLCYFACVEKCSCNAYAYSGSKGCSIWDGELLNLKLSDADPGGRDLYLKFSLAGKKKSIWRNLAIIIPVMASATCAICVFGYLFSRMANQRGTMQRSLKRVKRLLIGFKHIPEDSANKKLLKDSVPNGEKPELWLYDFAGIADATNNFCSTNKLGEGGFGPVYKGKLQNGQEIAVKRLSKSSRQGIEELKNEVILISKLQHRNLVKLLGYCGEGEEDMLVYEYMPNKSLDAFLFDSRESALLDWNKRFDIIGGIARGLLYLHRDSRLRIIHRDLKVSNILLDENMNPKISDFGMARIFEGNQTIANTSRVVGTFGYMSPEYIMGGTFSEKSDVFSFGVLMLEIVSSKRNNSFYDPEQPLNLTLHAWRLWNEGKWSEIVDEALGDSYTPSEAMKCIHIGLLCVQTRAVDRPTMSAVDLMLSSETDLPTPKEPPFASSTSSDKSRFLQIYCSNNNLTQTTVAGR